MDSNLKYTDLLYFGYDWSEDGLNNAKLEKEFMNELRIRFIDVVFEDAYDSIKGYRQEVYLKESDNDDYYSWILANGWHNCSLTMQIIMMEGSEESKNKFHKYFNLAKEQYPENFKKV